MTIQHTARPEIHDRQLDADIAAHVEAFGRALAGIHCRDVGAHSPQIEGLRLYFLRTSAGLSIDEVEDRLLDLGEDVPTGDLRKWEAGDADSGRGIGVDIPASVLLAFPRVFGVPFGAVVSCWSCVRAELPAHFPQTTFGPRLRIDGVRIIQTRERLHLTRAEAAKRAGVSDREAELLERGKTCVSIDAFEAYRRTLGVGNGIADLVVV